MAWKNVQYQNGKFKTSPGGGGGSSTFSGLDDVDFSNLQNGQVPKYNSTTQKWENANESGGGGTVTDVEVDGVSVVNQQGVAEIQMPTPPTIPVTDVEVNGTSVVSAQNVAEIKSYKEITQAAYNALPASKTSDGVLYCIKDSAGADGFPPLIYSDEEREVGVWCDGKPLYQKTFRFNETAKNFSIDISQLNINEIISVQGMFTRLVSGYPRFWYPMSNYESTAVYGSLQISGANGVENQVLSWYLVVEATDRQIITIQYTKTTDTAGSGTWNSQGALAHHYSTDEHVIGTWIDGSTIYEKTFWLSSRTAVTNDYTTIIISDTTAYNIKNIINAVGYDNNGGADTDLVRLLTGNIDFILSGGNQLIAYTSTNNTYQLTGFTLQYTKTA